MTRRAALAAAACLVLATTAAHAQGADVRQRPLRPVFLENVAPLLGDGEFYAPPTADDRLESGDEIAFVRALGLLQTERVGEGLAALQELAARYPDSRRVTAATASALIAAGRPADALKLVEEATKRLPRAGSGQWAREAKPRDGELPDADADPYAPRPRSPEQVYARPRAEALLALGKRPQAIPWMVTAASDPSARAARLREMLIQWAPSDDLGPRVLEAATKQSDAAPADLQLALLAAEIESRAGRMDAAAARLRRAEERTHVPRHGELLRVLAERLGARGPSAALTGAWIELARGAAYDPELRAAALTRLLAPEPDSDPGLPRPVAAPSADLEAAWRTLPAGPARSRLGLELVDFLRGRGQEEEARRVLAAMDAASTPADVRGRLDLQKGLAALQDGDLPGARVALARVDAAGGDPEAAERAQFGLAETRFYAAEFDSALAAYDAFARAHPESPLANDALERAYLLESGAEGGGTAGRAPGLASLARGLYAEQRRDWEAAARAARDAEAEARAANPQGIRSDPDSEGKVTVADPVRAQALLLLSRAEERRGAAAAALAAARIVADSLVGDRLAPQASQRAGDLLLALGRPAEALAQYEDLLVRYPRSWLAAEVRRKVTELRARGNP